MTLCVSGLDTRQPPHLLAKNNDRTLFAPLKENGQLLSYGSAPQRCTQFLANTL